MVKNDVLRLAAVVLLITQIIALVCFWPKLIAFHGLFEKETPTGWNPTVNQPRQQETSVHGSSVAAIIAAVKQLPSLHDCSARQTLSECQETDACRWCRNLCSASTANCTLLQPKLQPKLRPQHQPKTQPKLSTVAPLKKNYLDTIWDRYNLTYPEGWTPKKTNDAPSRFTFVYEPGRLEFVHIPKTGGTMVESTAARLNVSWGVCHFSPPKNAFIISHGEMLCPGNVPIRNWLPQVSQMPWWHLPPYYFTGTDIWKVNPYQDAKLFCIVRNPAERMVSEYHYFAKYSLLLSNKQRNTAERMNEFVKTNLEKLQNSNRGNLTQGVVGDGGYFQAAGHFIPQYEYVFDHVGKQVITHVLKFETLHKDFAKLMKEYKMSIPLPAKDVRMGRNYEKLIGVKNLTPDVIALIEEVYKQDFEFFGYQKPSESTY